MLNEEAFEAVATRMNNIVDEVASPISDKIFPPVVYHYTDAPGLSNILNGGKLWLNDIFRQNDPSEVLHGYQTAVDVFIAQAHRRNAQHAKEVAMYASHLLATSGIKEAARLFSLSFSAKQDDLSQWRAYADDGRGFAIGFDGPRLESLFLSSPLHGERASFQIQYDQKALEDNQTRLADCLIDYIEQQSEEFNQDSQNYFSNRQMLIRQFANSAIPLGILFKHPAYKGEEEFRLLQICSYKARTPGMLTRVGRPYRIIRYNELDWKSVSPSLLKEIIVGPSNVQDGINFASDCLDVYLENKAGVGLRESYIPYKTAR